MYKVISLRKTVGYFADLRIEAEGNKRYLITKEGKMYLEYRE